MHNQNRELRYSAKNFKTIENLHKKISKKISSLIIFVMRDSESVNRFELQAKLVKYDGGNKYKVLD